MAKYVCDFEQVYSVGEKLCQTASDTLTAVQTYDSRIESDLSSWTGTAKDSFLTTNSEQIKTATDDVSYINDLGEFIKSASKSIQELEEELSSLTI